MLPFGLIDVKEMEQFLGCFHGEYFFCFCFAYDLFSSYFHNGHLKFIFYIFCITVFLLLFPVPGNRFFRAVSEARHHGRYNPPAGYIQVISYDRVQLTLA